MTKTALVTGITGQDGSYLAELLIEKGYEVYGLVRRTSSMNRNRIDDYFPKEHKQHLRLIYGDLTDLSSLIRAVDRAEPDEIYNLGAQSHVHVSFFEPEYTAEVTGLGALKVFEAARVVNKNIKLYQAGSSEMFGKTSDKPQNESTPFYPRSPYGNAKVFAHGTAVNYRESYQMFISNGILFNHESPRRGENFVTRKITLGACSIKLGLSETLELGNLDAKRDWGYAHDYVEAMWRMLQQTDPGDFVVATGKTHSVREFCHIAFSTLGLNYEDYVTVNPKYFRPAEVDFLLGDPKKAKNQLNWTPKTSLEELVEKMIRHDYEKLSSETK